MMNRFAFNRFDISSEDGGLTPCVRWLILFNIGVFALQLVLHPLEVVLSRPSLLFDSFGFRPGNFFQLRLWEPFTYQFLHGGLMQLTMNMLWLFFFGPDVERLLGGRQFFRFYIACGFLGVLATLLPMVLFMQNGLVVGASASVMGVLVAFAMIDPKRQLFLFPFPVPVSAVGLVALVVVMNILFGMNGSGALNLFTHLGGMGAGYGLMTVIPYYQQWKREKMRERMAREKESKSDSEKVGEAVDNIFKFKGRR